MRHLKTEMDSPQSTKFSFNATGGELPRSFGELNPQSAAMSQQSNKQLSSTNLRLIINKRVHRPTLSTTLDSKHTASIYRKYSPAIRAITQTAQQKHSNLYEGARKAHQRFKLTQVEETKLNAALQTYKSTHPHGEYLSYGVCTFKGVRTCLNSHHIAIHLAGNIKHIALVSAYDGQFAGGYLKKEYNRTLVKSIKDSPIDSGIIDAFVTAQRDLMKLQVEKGDNSGASLLSLILHEGIIYAANCGVSDTICRTKGGQLLRLTERHDTTNQSQVNRAIKKGMLYRTEVSVPGSHLMGNSAATCISGPLRIYPSGLMYTRTLGRAIDYRHGGVLEWIPEIRQIKASEVDWVAVLSECVLNVMSVRDVDGIVKEQMRKWSACNDEHEVAREASRRIVKKSVERGALGSVSAVVLLMKPAKAGETVLTRPKSLKYVGGKHNFVLE